FLGPGGKVFPRIEVPRSSLVLHELREAHGVASNEGGRKNLCALSDDPERRTGRGSPRPRGRRPRRTGVRRPRRVRGAIRRPTKGTMEGRRGPRRGRRGSCRNRRSEEHTSELQSRFDLVCRLLLEKKKNKT